MLPKFRQPVYRRTLGPEGEPEDVFLMWNYWGYILKYNKGFVTPKKIGRNGRLVIGESQQWISKSDKNDNNIYAGDIIKRDIAFLGTEPEIATIVYSEDQSMYGYDVDDSGPLCLDFSHEMEIIGNIIEGVNNEI